MLLSSAFSILLTSSCPVLSIPSRVGLEHPPSKLASITTDKNKAEIFFIYSSPIIHYIVFLSARQYYFFIVSISHFVLFSIYSSFNRSNHHPLNKKLLQKWINSQHRRRCNYYHCILHQICFMPHGINQIRIHAHHFLLQQNLP